MKHRSVLLVLTIIFCISCNTVSEMRLQSQAEFTSPTIHTLPFNYIKQLIVVKAAINQSDKPYHFIFDTGAFQSKVEHKVAENLKLNTEYERSNSTAQGITKRVEITTLDSILLGNAPFYNIAAGKLKYSKTSYSPCIAKHGIIGSNLIKLAHWKIDYQNQTLQFSSEKFNLNPEINYAMLPFSTSFLSGIPEIEIEINGKIIDDVIFDLGYNGGLVLPMPYANQFKTEKTQTIIDQSTSGIFGTNRDTLLVKKLEVNIGGISQSMPVEFSAFNKALIGNDVLEHFTIYIDYEDNNIYLEPQSKVDIETIKTFIPGRLNDSLWIVNRTTAELPFKINDTLRYINTKTPRDLFSSHCDYFFGISKLLKQDSLIVIDHQKKRWKLSL